MDKLDQISSPLQGHGSSSVKTFRCPGISCSRYSNVNMKHKIWRNVLFLPREKYQVFLQPRDFLTVMDRYKLNYALQCCLAIPVIWRRSLLANKNNKPEQHNQHDKHIWSRPDGALSPEVSHACHNHEGLSASLLSLSKEWMWIKFKIHKKIADKITKN